MTSKAEMARLPRTPEGLEQRRAWLRARGIEFETFTKQADPRYYQDGDTMCYATIRPWPTWEKYGAKMLVTHESQQALGSAIITRTLCRLLDKCAQHVSIDWGAS